MNTFHIFLPDLANIIIPLNGLLNKEKRLQKKMRLLRQNCEKMDSETYAKELTF